MVNKIREAAESAHNFKIIMSVAVGLAVGGFVAGSRSERAMGMPARVHALEEFRKDTAAVNDDVAQLRATHAVDILRVERKLDCALWNLPAGCRETMSPR